jgi:poly-gamma-glutamate synthesis protein (capsule biosynthesis protein)
MIAMAPTVRVCRRRKWPLGAIGFAFLLLAAPVPSTAAASAPGRWIYLRGGALPSADEPVVEVLAVGDVMTGRGMETVPDIFGHVSDALRAADVTIGNLEGAISDEPVPPESVWLHLPLDTPTMLDEAGFDLLGVANNHSLDADRSGLAETRRLLRAEGLEPVEARSLVREIDGLAIAFLAWNDLGDPDPEPLLASVRGARAIADGVVVMVHWGREYQRHPSLPQRDLAGALLDAGADVVVGAHPHVVQDLEIVQPTASDRTRLIAYSLGNFVFDQGWGDTGQGLALRLVFDAAGLRAAQALPLTTAPRPRWMDPDSASPLFARILPAERVGFACFEGACELVDVPTDLRSGIFNSAAIDLTGDGLPETVRMEAGLAEIVQGDRSVWRSPPEWHVRDVSVGDPNDDGRNEVLLAVGTKDGSQPFIVGYRGGRYHDLWGGSPVSDPILEVELADLDGDGLEELVAIETSADGSADYLTLWRWHGWGFSLVWRSPPGAYHDLVILPAQDDLPARLSVSVR